MDRPVSGAARGYTLVELIIAIALAAVVLYAVAGVTGSMVRFGILGLTRGDVTTWAVFNLNRMHKDIENATHLEVALDGTTLGGCSNWASQWDVSSPDDRLQKASGEDSVRSFHYCIGTVGGVQSLLLYSNDSTTCVPPVPSGCGTGSYYVVAKHFYKGDGATTKYFAIGAQPNVVELRYIVGISTPNITGSGKAPFLAPAGSGLHQPMPQYLKVDTAIRWNKAYLNTAD